MGRKKIHHVVPKQLGVACWLVNQKEDRRKSPPTEDDIEETYDILDDFGIRKLTVPDFATYGELEKWRKEKCKNACV